MIKDLLKVKNCFIKESVKNWEDAICVACAPVIEQGYCTKEYEDAVFENTEKFGPYYVLCENLALNPCEQSIWCKRNTDGSYSFKRTCKIQA